MFNLAVSANKIDFGGSWGKVWAAVESGFPGISLMLTSVGMILVVFALAKYAWDRRRGGGNASPLWNTLIIGALLLLPTVVIPLALLLLSGIANIVVKVVQAILPGAGA